MSFVVYWVKERIFLVEGIGCMLRIFVIFMVVYFLNRYFVFGVIFFNEFYFFKVEDGTLIFSFFGT